MDGIIIINKEKDYTSNDVVQIVKKIFKEKVGHTGTLDPIATGVLPILIGKGTLLSKYLINHDKIYLATLRLGKKTDTGDIKGKVIDEKNVEKSLLKKENIEKALESIVGEQDQIPPMFSAIKVKGKKLYEYARQGKKIEVQPRKIKIYEAKLINIIPQTNEIQFRVKCSKGTYIRTLCEKIAEELGTVGAMSELNREEVGEFNIKQSIKIKDLKEHHQEEQYLRKHIITIEDFFKDKGQITLSPRSYIAFLNGVKLLTDELNGIYRIYDINNKFIGIGNVNNGILKRDIVI